GTDNPRQCASERRPWAPSAAVPRIYSTLGRQRRQITPIRSSTAVMNGPGGFVVGNLDKTVGLWALAFMLGSLCVPFEAFAQTAAPAGCAEAPASRHTVNVRDKGAKGDGRTDDAAAIQ